MVQIQHPLPFYERKLCQLLLRTLKRPLLVNLKRILFRITITILYRYFAKIAREEGYEEIAEHFEYTADQEFLHSWGHLELLVGKPSTKQCLEMAIEVETHEFISMYPDFKRAAEIEGNTLAVMEAAAQIEESKEHAEQFSAVLAKAEKRFSALAKVEKRHAEAYQQVLESL